MPTESVRLDLAQTLPTDPAAAPTAPIVQLPLGEQVYSRLRAQIISGRLRPGEKLSDLRLSAELHVSRTPVREALYRLAQEGVVRVSRGRGFAVARLNRRDVRELYEIRLGLELLAVRLGGPRLTPEALAAAQRAHEVVAGSIGARADGVAAAFARADRDLHHALFLATQNRRLLAMREGLQAQLEVLGVYGLRLEPLMVLSVEHHAAILAALAARDWCVAETAMAHHIEVMQAHALAVFDGREAP